MATFIFPSTPISIPGVATEATLLLVETNTADTVTELQTLNAKDFATETTLAALAAVDFATENTLSNVATEATLSSIDSKISNVNTDSVTVTSSVLPTGAASETTLAALDAKVTAVDTDSVTVVSSSLPTGAATETSLAAAASDLADLNARLAGNLVPEEFDFISLTYVLAGDGQGEISTVTYKTGGSGGTTVATLTLLYDANDKLSSVTRS